MNKTLTLIGALAWLGAAACASDSFSTVPTSTGATEIDRAAATDPCAAGQLRCSSLQLERCQDGVFVLDEMCKQACSTTLGCVACDPKLGNTCSDNNVHECLPDGSVGAELEKCYTEPCGEGMCGISWCSQESKLIYVVDRDNRLLSFSPANGANEFKLIKTLNCPAGASLQDGQKATPFSMSVDRTDRAWILYTSGEIFWADIKTGECQKSGFTPKQKGFELFGMGFVSETPSSSVEKLYITGGSGLDLAQSLFGYIDPQTMQVTSLGKLAAGGENNPELTGTGKATLYGYFPGASNTFVAQLNKETGAVQQKWPLSALGGQTVAWAFAHWGGKFFIFVSTQTDLMGPEISDVIRLDPATGKSEKILSKTPYAIVGAGVSTCAPTIE